MGVRLNNLGNLFRDTRSRTIIIITAIIIILALLIGYWKLRSTTPAPGQVTVGRVPVIESIPGSLNPTEEYARLQQEQNVQQATAAKQTGKSAIPTIIRTELFSQGTPQTPPSTGLPFNVLARKLREGGIAKGIWFDDVKNSNCSKVSLDKAREQGATPDALKDAGCTAKQLLAGGYSLPALKQAGYSATDLKAAGFNAMQLRGAGFDAAELRKANFSACDAKNAGFSAKELKQAGYSDGELLGAGFEPKAIQAAGGGAPLGGCDEITLTRLRQQGKDATSIRQSYGCSAQALKNAGFSAIDLKPAGFTAAQLREVGFPVTDLKNAGFTAGDLKSAGYTPRELRSAGFSANDLQEAGFTPTDLKNGGFTDAVISRTGFTPSELVAANIPVLPTTVPRTPAPAVTSENAELQRIMQAQAQQMDQQQYQQLLQNRQNTIGQQVNGLLSRWADTPQQMFVAGAKPTGPGMGGASGGRATATGYQAGTYGQGVLRPATIKAGDIVFAVMDTAVNSDEPGPILATVVQGKLKGARLIGSLRLPPGGERVILTFNLMSLKSAPTTIPINAVAIDPETARTAISSDTDHHYLSRYGALFASAFMEGYGQAVQSQGTTAQIGSDGFSSSFTVANRNNQQLLEIAGGKIGQEWARQVRKHFDRPPTVQVYSGSSLGILFLQDLPEVPGVNKENLIDVR